MTLNTSMLVRVAIAAVAGVLLAAAGARFFGVEADPGAYAFGALAGLIIWD